VLPENTLETPLLELYAKLPALNGQQPTFSASTADPAIPNQNLSCDSTMKDKVTQTTEHEAHQHH
jgi:hypothetical protein